MVQFLLSFEIKEDSVVGGSGEEENERSHGLKESDAVVVNVSGGNVVVNDRGYFCPKVPIEKKENIKINHLQIYRP